MWTRTLSWRHGTATWCRSSRRTVKFVFAAGLIWFCWSGCYERNEQNSTVRGGLENRAVLRTAAKLDVAAIHGAGGGPLSASSAEALGGWLCCWASK